MGAPEEIGLPPMRVRHFANKDLEMTVVWKSARGKIPWGGVPAVATVDGQEFYAGEIIDDTLIAVDLLTNFEDAYTNAERRDWRTVWR